MKRQLKENECQFAEKTLDRHKVVAQLGGVVVEVDRRRGEWVEPGDRVFRIIRIDHLQAEGFVDARVAQAKWLGRAVTLRVNLGDPEDDTTSFPGEIVFVSPEIDPVNGQVAVWAEIENRDLALRPGLVATLVIEDEGS